MPDVLLCQRQGEKVFATGHVDEYVRQAGMRVHNKAEAHKILSQFQDAREPNSPEGTHYMAQVSLDFLARASSKDHERLMKEILFPSLSLSTLKDQKGVFAFISKDEDRFHPPRRGRASVLDQLQKTPDVTKTPKPVKKKEMEL